ncbi:MAG: ribonuclease H-like YkuK family protein [Thermaerobacter sp.]|nr:ribonuclease H-like YkuK family protein [Thermaerobacter sp.]
MIFESPSKGRMSFEAMFGDLLAYLGESPDDQYKLIVGTDSHTRHETILVTAVVIHHIGKGGRYYFHKSRRRAIGSLRQKIFYETSTSLTVAAQLTTLLEASGFAEFDVEIHIDVGQQGETKELIREIVGMVTGSGYQAAIKPHSFGASKVADKYTK